MAEKVACVGAGNVGRSWAIVFARAGYEVALYDGVPAVVTGALDAIARSLADMKVAGLIDDVDTVRTRIRPAKSLADALDGAAYVQESVYEDLELKRRVFAELDRAAAPSAILASSVSSIPASQFLNNLTGGARCIVAHPINPPHVIPVVEVLLGPSTTEETYERACSVLRDADQVPVRLNKECTGYVLNRLQFAIINEALHLVDGGYVSAEDIDKIVKYGLGRRWAFMGLFETNHLNANGGLREYYGKFDGAIRSTIEDLFLEPHPLDSALIGRVAEEMEQTTPISDVPARQAWRDRELMALARHFSGAKSQDR